MVVVVTFVIVVASFVSLALSFAILALEKVFKIIFSTKKINLFYLNIFHFPRLKGIFQQLYSIPIKTTLLNLGF